MELIDLPSVYVFLVFFLISCYVKYQWSRRKLYAFSSQLPGPFAYPVLGNALKFLCKKEDVLNVFLELTTPYPSPSRFWIGPKLFVFVKHPDQLQIILQSPKMATKSRYYRFLEPFLGQGLLTASGSLYKTHKKLFHPLFTQRRIEAYSHLFQKHANKFVQRMRHYTDGEEFDIMSYLPLSTFEATMDVLLEDSNIHSIDYNLIPHFIRRFSYMVFKRIRNFWLHSDFIYERTSYYKEQRKLKEMATAMIEEIMNTTLIKIIQRIESGSSFGEMRTPSVLEMLVLTIMENPESLTVQQCVDHLMTLIGASHDTTNLAIAFTCLMLGVYPDKQRLVIQEMKEVLGDKKTLELTDVSKLKYLEMCIKESLRLFPPVPMLFRDTTEEHQLGDLTIPKDVTVILSIYHAHKDPTFWEKPNEFHPEHFSAEAASKRNPFAFIPFSVGPRKCLASAYAYTNMKIFIATFLLNYEIECRQKVEDIKLSVAVTLKPVNDRYFMKIKKRKDFSSV